MRVAVGLENNFEGRSLAWALEYPGCFAYGRDESEALLRVPQALVLHAGRIQERAQQPWLALGDFDVRLVETWTVYHVDAHYELAADGNEVNAWFRHDWKPLSMLEARRGLELLSWGRADLLELVGELTPAELERERPGERWSIAGILKHLGGAEWWYLDRLGQAGMARAALPADPFERLEVTRRRLEAALPELAGQEQVVGKEGEFWSPRKLLRRAAWHELDHIGHISRLILEGL